MALRLVQKLRWIPERQLMQGIQSTAELWAVRSVGVQITYAER